MKENASWSILRTTWMCRLNVTRKWNSGYDNATRNGLQEVVTIMRLKWWYKEWYKNGWQYPAISERSFSGKESNFSNSERQTWHTRWHFAMPHRMADFSPFVLWGTRNFRSILLRQTRERRRKFALSHRTPSPSITAATVLSAEMRPRYTRRIQRARFAVEYVEKSYERDTCQINRKQFVPGHKSGIESIEPCGNTAGSGTWRYWQLNSISCF